MSRVGRNPIPIPDGVKVDYDAANRYVCIRGKLGDLERVIPEGISLKMENDTIVVHRTDDSRNQRALHGLTRALLANMVAGVKDGYAKNLEIVGVGYRVEQRGPALQFTIGFSHRVIFFPPDGITLKVNTPTNLSVSGIDKELVGEVAAKIRSIRPPEPYRGKGIKYVDEVVRRKAGKAAGK